MSFTSVHGIYNLLKEYFTHKLISLRISILDCAKLFLLIISTNGHKTEGAVAIKLLLAVVHRTERQS